MIPIEDVIQIGEKVRAKSGIILILVLPLMMTVGLNDFSFCYFILGCVFLLALFFIIMFYRVRRWRLWALENVDNPQLFRTRAQELLLIPQNKIFEKYEFNSKKYRDKWMALQERYSEPEFEYNDPEIISGLFYFRGSFWKILSSRDYTVFRISSKSLQIDKNQIIENNSKEYLWSNITDEKVQFYFYVSGFKGRTYFLEFDYLGSFIQIPLGIYSVNPLYIERIIKNIRNSFNNRK